MTDQPTSADPLAEVPEADRIPVGSRVRVKHASPFEEGDAPPEGAERVVAGYVSAEEGDAEPPRPYYVTERFGGDFGEDYADVDQIEVIMTPAQHDAAMAPPDVEAVARMVFDGIMSGSHDGWEAFEGRLLTSAPTEDDGGFERPHGYVNGVEFYGRRSGGGGGAGVIVRITSMWPTDD